MWKWSWALKWVRHISLKFRRENDDKDFTFIERRRGNMRGANHFGPHNLSERNTNSKESHKECPFLFFVLELPE